MIRYALGTEKSIRMMEAENKLIFAVERKATKPEIKKSIEEMFNAQVISVNTHNTMKGKRAIVTFGADTAAIDIATNLGLL